MSKRLCRCRRVWLIDEVVMQDLCLWIDAKPVVGEIEDWQ